MFCLRSVCVISLFKDEVFNNIDLSSQTEGIGLECGFVSALLVEYSRRTAQFCSLLVVSEITGLPPMRPECLALPPVAQQGVKRNGMFMQTHISLTLSRRECHTQRRYFHM